jgi:predicted  nucleic acid-binding Zn-ribbon protein
MTESVPLREQVRALESLQELDLRIQKLTEERAELPARHKEIDSSLAAARALCATKTAAIDERAKGRRQVLAAIELVEDRLRRATERLDGVTNNQSFQAATKEMEQLRKLRASLEEQKTKVDEEIARLRAELAPLEAEAGGIQQRRDVGAVVVDQRIAEIDGHFDGLRAERVAMAKPVPASMQLRYDRIRKARAGLGIVPVVGGRCRGCNMMLPPQQVIEMHKWTELHYCPSCHRILFLPAEGEAAPKTG